MKGKCGKTTTSRREDADTAHQQPAAGQDLSVAHTETLVRRLGMRIQSTFRCVISCLAAKEGNIEPSGNHVEHIFNCLLSTSIIMNIVFIPHFVPTKSNLEQCKVIGILWEMFYTENGMCMICDGWIKYKLKTIICLEHHSEDQLL